MKIPTELTLFARPTTRRHMVNGETVRCRETYPAYAASKSRMKSAAEWAGEKRTELTVPNLFHMIRLIDLETRAEGGRAYKVLLADTYLVDLREDVVMQTLLAVGVQMGGYIDATFAFGVNGSQFKLYWTESADYKALLAEDAEVKTRAVKPKPGQNDYEFGRVYEDASYIYLYLGRVRTPRFWKTLVNGNEIRAYEHAKQYGQRSEMRQFFSSMSKMAGAPGGIGAILGGIGFGDVLTNPEEQPPTPEQLVEPTPIYTYKEREKAALYHVWVRLDAAQEPKSFDFTQLNYRNELQLNRTATRYDTGRTIRTPGFANTTEMIAALQAHVKKSGRDYLPEFKDLADATVVK